jgi:DDE superfamily endonuclease
MEHNTLLALTLILIIYYRRRRQHQTQPRWRPSYEYCRESFSIELLPPGRAKYWLRFTVPEIQRLAPLLQLDQVEYRNRQIVDPTTALCVVCARLSYPGRWIQLADLFGRSPTWLSIIFNDIITFLSIRFKDHLRWHRQITQYSRLLEFSEAVEQLNTIQGIWGFVDGTFKGHCRPTGYTNQRIVYSGHKRAHGMNWQAIVTPDGLISSLVGPYSGANNDWSMWQRSGCEAEIRSVCTGHPTLYIYGDPAYRASFGVMCPFEHPKGRHYLTPEKQAFNKALAQVRISVENAFGSLHNKWTYTAFSGGLVAGLQPVAAQFTTAVLLANCYICLRRPENRFLISPITIEEYLY